MLGSLRRQTLRRIEKFGFLNCLLMAWALLREAGAMASEDGMFQVDPWEKAADCERALRITIDPVHRENLTNIREFWISLANKRPFLSEREFAKRAETIGRLHTRLTATTSIH
jgi:hypothetical protein